MRNFLFLTILGLIAFTYGQTIDDPTTPSFTITTVSSTTKAPESTVSTTTSIPETTVPTTTTNPEDTTSTTMTSTATSTTSTTSSSISTTSSPISTASRPISSTTNAPIDIVPVYEVSDADGNVCIRLQVLASLKIFYTINGKDDGFMEFDLKNRKVTPSGECGNNNQTIILVWMPENSTKLWNMTVNFGQIDQQSSLLSGDAKFYGVKKLTLEYVLEEAIFPDTNTTGNAVLQSTGMNFKAKTGAYYACKSGQTIQLSSKTLPGANLLTKDLKVQAYHTGKEHEFTGDITVCESDSTSSSVVPIAVGVTLAVLILIALITFVIGSRRRQNNYETI